MLLPELVAKRPLMPKADNARHSLDLFRDSF